MAVTQARGLGRGLSALIGETRMQTGAAVIREASEEGAPVVLPVQSLRSGKYQPRQRFEDGALAELAQSIRANGLVQPILVRQSGNFYEIIAGERRWRAAQMAGLQQVPVVVRELSDRQALELALVENIQRQDLNPLEEALGYQRLQEEFGHTQEALAQAVGKSRSHITNLLRLLQLPDEVKSLLEDGKLSMGHARALIGLPNAAALAEEVVRKNLSVRDVERLVREGGEAESTRRARPSGQRDGYRDGQGAGATLRHASERPAPEKHSDIIALEETLSEALGLRVSIEDRGGQGEIILRYQSLSQLDEVLRRLGGGI